MDRVDAMHVIENRFGTREIWKSEFKIGVKKFADTCRERYPETSILTDDDWNILYRELFWTIFWET